MCDGICNSTPTTPYDCINIIFAAWAALQVIIDYETRGMSDNVVGYIHQAANDYVLAKVQTDNATSLPPAPGYSDVPPHLQDAIYPQHQKVDSSGRYTNLIGQTIRYRDSRHKEIRECEVNDCGTSHMRGDWYLITHTDSEEEMMITAGEMNDILESRVSTGAGPPV
ncbi:hypothetical protein AX14_008325 [Amanita brunnescens Koide BX004]|nr:hypothetical protein AX14_008325 [Amanita brunnescens Koide BX004]